jgi:SAM-dependent methyltransferase
MDCGLERYRKFGWEYHCTQGAGSQFGDLEWFLDVAQANEGPVLDLGCGSGRLLLPLRRAGLSVVGLDGSLSLLMHCRGEATSARVQGEFGRLCFRPCSFGTVIFAGNTAAALPEELRRFLLREIREVLRPGGVFAVSLRRYDLARFDGGAPVVHRHEPLFDDTRGCWVSRVTELCYVPEALQVVARLRFRCEFPDGAVEEDEYRAVYAVDAPDRVIEEAQEAGLELERADVAYGAEGCSGPAAEMVGMTFRKT